MVAMQNKGVWYCYDKLSKSFKTWDCFLQCWKTKFKLMEVSQVIKEFFCTLEYLWACFRIHWGWIFHFWLFHYCCLKVFLLHSARWTDNKPAIVVSDWLCLCWLGPLSAHWGDLFYPQRPCRINGLRSLFVCIALSSPADSVAWWMWIRSLREQKLS